MTRRVAALAAAAACGCASASENSVMLVKRFAGTGASALSTAGVNHGFDGYGKLLSGKF